MHDTAPAAEAAAWLANFSETLGKGDIAATIDLFAEDCYWRDLVAFTWNVKTMEGKAAIAEMLQATLRGGRALGLAGDQGVRFALAVHRGLVQLPDPRGTGAGNPDP